MPWSAAFEDPVVVKGKTLPTLGDAASYIMKLPKAEQDLPEWQAAIEALIMAAGYKAAGFHGQAKMLIGAPARGRLRSRVGNRQRQITGLHCAGISR